MSHVSAFYPLPKWLPVFTLPPEPKPTTTTAPENAAPDAPMSNTARPLGSERHLRLVPRDARAEHNAKVNAAVASLDAKLAEAPPDPACSPVQVGHTEKFVNPFDALTVSWVHRLVGGQRIIVN